MSNNHTHKKYTLYQLSQFSMIFSRVNHKRPDFTFPVDLRTPDIITARKPRDLNPRLAPMFQPLRDQRKLTYLIDTEWLSERHPLDYLRVAPIDSGNKRSVTFADQ